MELEIFFDSLCLALLSKAKGRSSEQYLEIYFILHRYIYIYIIVFLLLLFFITIIIKSHVVCIIIIVTVIIFIRVMSHHPRLLHPVSAFSVCPVNTLYLCIHVFMFVFVIDLTMLSLNWTDYSVDKYLWIYIFFIKYSCCIHCFCRT